MKSSTSKALWYTSLAAGAAVGPAAQGSVIYTDIADIKAPTIQFDLDNGGSVDFRLEVVASGAQQKSNLVPISSNIAAGIALNLNNNADRMAAGESIGLSTPFSNPTETKTLFDGASATPTVYDWAVGSRGFLGLRFDLDGTTHYGWADVSINALTASTFDHTLYGYAYESTPAMAILAGTVPEPTTAMLLVAGAAGAASVRRRQS